MEDSSFRDQEMKVCPSYKNSITSFLCTLPKINVSLVYGDLSALHYVPLEQLLPWMSYPLTGEPRPRDLLCLLRSQPGWPWSPSRARSTGARRYQAMGNGEAHAFSSDLLWATPRGEASRETTYQGWTPACSPLSTRSA